jgi:XTP/dITP diphosphohydrolase
MSAIEEFPHRSPFFRLFCSPLTMQKLILATSNPGKLREIGEYLTDLALDLQLKPEDLEIEETENTFEGNAALKASQIARVMGEWAIADDSGLAVTALGGAPGIYSARYGNSDRQRIDRLLKELGDQSDRSACFICAVAIARPDGSIAFAVTGVCPGEILPAPRGEGGFGYDPIFYVPAYGLTFAEMPPELKRQVSHRGKAFEALLPFLREL